MGVRAASAALAGCVRGAAAVPTRSLSAPPLASARPVVGRREPEPVSGGTRHSVSGRAGEGGPWGGAAGGRGAAALLPSAVGSGGRGERAGGGGRRVRQAGEGCGDPREPRAAARPRPLGSRCPTAGGA